MERKCKDCGKTFKMSNSEVDFFNSKDLHLPKRCKDCRQKNRGTQPSTQPVRRTSYSRSSNYTRPRRSSIHSTLLLLLVIAVFVFVYTSLEPLLVDTNPTVTITPSSSVQETVTTPDAETQESTPDPIPESSYNFRTYESYIDHFNKHGGDMGYATAEDYLAGANKVILADDVLSKFQDDGDTAYFLESTREFAVVSPDGYIRTYFKPDDGIDYFNRQ